jgi:hypothetical protein
MSYHLLFNFVVLSEHTQFKNEGDDDSLTRYSAIESTTETESERKATFDDLVVYSGLVARNYAL